MSASSPESAVAAMQDYARARGLSYYDHWTLPEATQLLHHGAFDDARNVLIGDLPGGLQGSWLAHFVAAPTGLGSDGRCYTVAIVAAATSVRFAVRVLCHDRDLARAEASNPDAERETVSMDDRAVVVESEAFLRRYELSTDHDQDQVRAWQLFDPALIEWLTNEAPEDFSFELQNGALCCFVPGAVADSERLDDLCAATARIRRRVLELGDDPDRSAAGVESGPGTREDVVSHELARHPFARPPRSVLSAAIHFGGIPLISRSSRRLGVEAFFRAHAEALGLERIEPSEFLAGHIDIAIPGAITQVARGRLPGTGIDGYLIFTTDADNSQISWTVVVADISQADNGFAFVDLTETREAEKDGFDVGSNGSTITVWKPDRGPYARTAKRLDRFCQTACPLLEQAVAAATRRPG